MGEFIPDDAKTATAGAPSIPPTDPGMVEKIRAFLLGGGMNNDPDMIGRIKQMLLRDPEPGTNTPFGESDLPGRIVRGAGEFLIPGSIPEAATSVALGNLGPIARAVEKVPIVGAPVKAAKSMIKGGIEAAGELFRPGVYREAGAEVAAKAMGQPMESTTRALGEKASSKAYEAVKAVKQDVDITGLIQDAKLALTGPMGLSNPPAKAVRWIDNMEKKLTGPQPYSRITKEISALRGEAERALGGIAPDSNTAKVLYGLRASALDELDKISPAIKQANQLYRNEETSQSIISVLRKGNTGTKMRELIENDPLVAGMFKGNEKGLKDMYAIADKLGSIAGESPMGMGNRILGAINNLSEPFINDDTARSMLRWTLDNTEKVKLPGAINTLNQLIGQTTRGAAFKAVRGE